MLVSLGVKFKKNAMINRPAISGAICAAAVAAIFGLALMGAWLNRSGALDVPNVRVQKMSFSGLPGWQDDAQAQALPTFVRSCERIRQREPKASLGSNVRSTELNDLFGVTDDWREVCNAASRVDSKDNVAARHFFESWFTPVQIFESARRQGFLTGYYEPQLEGSWRRSPAFDVPLLRLPTDLVQVDLGNFRDGLKGERVAGRVVGSNLQPYDTRAQITAGALDAEDRTLVWVNDTVDAFFLHIQGSGRVVMQDGTVIRVAYAGQNGRAYSAIGRILVERGELTLEETSMQSIRLWLNDHPLEAGELMDVNESYIFFKEAPVGNPLLGPVGAQNVPLTPRRSLAVDRRYYALGLPVWIDIDTTALKFDGEETSLRILTIAQDTGGAIRGPQRGDYFLGFGDEAGEIAGRMRAEGRFFALILSALAEAHL
jgi:membrane-bound lytic murein transglycosylase A